MKREIENPIDILIKDTNTLFEQIDVEDLEEFCNKFNLEVKNEDILVDKVTKQTVFYIK